MKGIGRLAAVVTALGLAVLASAPGARAGSTGEAEVKGVGEFLKSGVLIVDGQRVRLAPETKTKGVAKGQPVPLGAEVKARGAWRPDGSLQASRIEVKPNTRDNGEQE